MDDRQKFQQHQSKQLKEWEDLCANCGACCGLAEGDPCEHLRQIANNRTTCAIYDDRFGEHKTISGKPFHCVPLRDILHKDWPGKQSCAIIRKKK